MKKLLIPIIMIMITLMAAPAFAAQVTFSSALLSMTDTFGDPLNGSYAFVIDTDDDGWNGNSYLSSAVSPIADNYSSWLWDSDDYLLDVGDITFGMGFPDAPNVEVSTIPNYTVGDDEVYVLWFDKPYDSGLAGPGSNVAYDAAFVGLTIAEGGFTSQVFAPGNPGLVTGVAPEPVSSVLMLVGASAMGLRRRFKGIKA